MEWVVLGVAIVALAVMIFVTVYLQVSERGKAVNPTEEPAEETASEPGLAQKAFAAVDRLATQDGLPPADPLLPPVVLPEDPVAEDIDRVRFAVGFNGYRVEEVDDFLDKVRDELTRRAERITELESQLGIAATVPATPKVPEA